MNSLISPAWAQSAPASTGGQFAPLFIVIFYFLLMRPQQKKTKEHQQLISKLAVGDEVVTNGGVLGRITDVGESFVTLEVADGVRIKVQKFQVSALMPKGTLRSA
jgi:preprotein translocase subunit YajC